MTAALTPETALVVYGTLAPGEVNHHAVSAVPGRWVDGIVRGYLFDLTWGPAEGDTGFTRDRDGHRVAVKVLCSDDWNRHWDRLDRFEGPGFRRCVVEVLDPDGNTMGQATVYECVPDAD